MSQPIIFEVELLRSGTENCFVSENEAFRRKRELKVKVGQVKVGLKKKKELTGETPIQRIFRKSDGNQYIYTN